MWACVSPGAELKNASGFDQNWFQYGCLSQLRMEAHDDMQSLPKVMEEIRKDLTTEGACLRFSYRRKATFG